MMRFPVAPPGATMAISFQSDEEVLRKLRERLRKMTDEELIKFGREVRRLAENPVSEATGRGESGVEAEKTLQTVVLGGSELVSDAKDSRFRMTLLSLGIAGIGSSVVAYSRRGWEGAIVSAVLWFGVGTVILFWSRSRKSKESQ
jgi:hypothetical protein